MPDITLCLGKECPLKEKCYRYHAKPSLLQSYFNDPPFDEKGCEYFIENKNPKS